MEINGLFLIHQMEKSILLPGLHVYNKNGQINSILKLWTDTVVADANGIFTVDWSSAGFTAPPINVQVTVLSDELANVQDRIFATMIKGFTRTSGRGYTLRGATVTTVFVGSNASLRTAPGATVSVAALGY